MFRNSQFSHIILLCAIAYVVYCLTCPSKTIKNSGTLEEISSSEKLKKDSSIVKSESDIKSEASDVNSESVESKGIVSEVESELKQTSNVLNNFKPEETKGGANLKAAFDKPIPKGSETNAVDFNKNYLKKYDSKNYLPKEVNDEWFDTDFSQAKKVKGDNLVNTDKYIIGVDTVGQSLKNASYDIRGTIANPKYNVSPWLNSTYEPDYNIKPLC